jgi:hypothetical protein
MCEWSCATVAALACMSSWRIAADCASTVIAKQGAPVVAIVAGANNAKTSRPSLHPRLRKTPSQLIRRFMK